MSITIYVLFIHFLVLFILFLLTLFFLIDLFTLFRRETLSIGRRFLPQLKCFIFFIHYIYTPFFTFLSTVSFQFISI